MFGQAEIPSALCCIEAVVLLHYLGCSLITKYVAGHSDLMVICIKLQISVCPLSTLKICPSISNELYKTQIEKNVYSINFQMLRQIKILQTFTCK